MTMTQATAAMPGGGVLDDVVLHHVITLDELDQCRSWLGSRHDGPVCADTESAALNPHRDRHRMTQLGDKRHGWAFPPAWMGAAHEMLAAWTAAGNRLGAYNWPYDARVFGHQSNLWLPWVQLDDAQLVTHLADSAAITGLKHRAARDIDPSAIVWQRQLDAAMTRQRWGFATVPDDFPLYWQYGGMDPVLTSWLLDRHLGDIRARFSASYDLELAYARLCANMMSAGMMIDRPWIDRWTAEISAWYAASMEWLAPYGITSPHNNGEVGQAMENAGVKVQRTGTGKAAVNKAAMESYQAATPHAAGLIRAIRDAKKAADILTRVLEKFSALADGDVMHYSIHSIGAQRTGRSSVTAPAMQTFDRDVPVIRGCFVPRPGNVFVSWDAAQIEMRLAAHFSGDRRLISDFLACDASGQSFFVNAASRIYGERVAKSDWRYTATKNTSYAMIYGSGMDTAANTAGVPLAQLEPVYKGWKRLYPTLDKWCRDLTDRTKSRGRRPSVETLSGRVLAVDRGREYSAVDYRVQGSAAEFLKWATISMDAAGYGDLLRLTIHDELFAEVPRADAQDVLRAGNQILTDRANFAVPIIWDGVIMEERWVKA